jgi:antitoxin (DNA-binding transcriptional repressor) of toxin-antitoxin stability system
MERAELSNSDLTNLTRIGKVDQSEFYCPLELILMIVNVSEAKTYLSRYIDMVYHGEEVVIAKNNLPLVDLVVHKPKGKRKLGLLKGKFTVPDNFFEEDDEINSMFYGDDRK